MNQLAFLEALGWSLLDSLWQTGVVWVLYILFTGNGQRSKASARHNLAALGIVLSSFWFISGFIRNYTEVVSGRFTRRPMYAFTPENMDLFISVLSSIYLVLVTYYSWRLFRKLLLTKRMYRDTLTPPDASLLAIFEALITQTGIRRPVSLYLSESVLSPLTSGFVKPVVLLPVAVLNQLSLEQAETVIAHELFHIKRNDYLVNLLLSTADVLLFFNPFARMLQDIVARERENSCDDEVLALGYNEVEYAGALYTLGRNSLSHHHLALAATGTAKQLLLQRVKRMLKGEQHSVPVARPLAVLFVCLSIVAGLGKAIVEPESSSVSYLTIPADYAAPFISSAPPEDPEIKIPGSITSTQQIILIPTKKTVSLTVRQASAGLFRKPLHPVEYVFEFLPEESSIPDEMDMENIYTYVSMSHPDAEFSMLTTEMSASAKPVGIDENLPFVQASAFYYPGTISDSCLHSDRKIIQL